MDVRFLNHRGIRGDQENGRRFRKSQIVGFPNFKEKAERGTVSLLAEKTKKRGGNYWDNLEGQEIISTRRPDQGRGQKTKKGKGGTVGKMQRRNRESCC